MTVLTRRLGRSNLQISALAASLGRLGRERVDRFQSVRWCRVLHAEVTTTVEAPRETVAAVYAEWTSWPRLFPTIGAVRLVRREGATLVLEVDHLEGKVVNELTVRSPGEIDLWEEKRRYDARFLNRFEAVPGGTRFTVSGEVFLKGWARLLQPFLGGYVRRQMRRLQLQPVKAEAEARARWAAEASPLHRHKLPGDVREA
jgi:Polyketide cyclase / dehydrase and lipid transport